jgi:hypothetical protein
MFSDYPPMISVELGQLESKEQRLVRQIGEMFKNFWERRSSGNGGDYFYPVIHFYFLGPVLSSTINGTTSYQFSGGHSCRGLDPSSSRDKVENYLRSH